MALIANPQLREFSNTLGRPAAQAQYEAYWRAKRVVQQWHARGIASLLAAAADGDEIADGSNQDGRTRLTKADVLNLVSNLEAQIAAFEAGSNAVLNVFTRPAVARE